jgi:hypothetical protein
VFAAIAFAVAGLLPSMYFLWAGFSDDPTATGSAGSAVAWLVGIVVVIGAVLGTTGWAAGEARNPATRAMLSTLVLVAAVGSGLVTGFLGGLVIGLARHPTWDDA